MRGLMANCGCKSIALNALFIETTDIGRQALIDSEGFFRGARMLRRWLLVGLAALTVLALAGEVGTPPASVFARPRPGGGAASGAIDIPFTQLCPGGGFDEQFFDVPGGVTQMKVTLYGAQGGAGFSSSGGQGALVQATFNVVAGTSYFVDIGCAGDSSGGWDGGGIPGTGASNDVGGGGGGATVLRSSPCASLPNPCSSIASGALLVAGGGGGGGGNAGSSSGGFGGGHIAGSANGQPGGPGADFGGAGGGGATPAAPGTATISNGSTAGDPGSVIGLGGHGSNSTAGSGAGGGGGGGCHGGGGGAAFSEGSAGGGLSGVIGAAAVSGQSSQTRPSGRRPRRHRRRGWGPGAK